MLRCLTSFRETTQCILATSTGATNRRRCVRYILDVQIRANNARAAADASVSFGNGSRNQLPHMSQVSNYKFYCRNMFLCSNVDIVWPPNMVRRSISVIYGIVCRMKADAVVYLVHRILHRLQIARIRRHVVRPTSAIRYQYREGRWHRP